MRHLQSILAAAAALSIAFSVPAEAARRHHQPTIKAGYNQVITQFCGDRVCTANRPPINRQLTWRPYKVHRAAKGIGSHSAAAAWQVYSSADQEIRYPEPRQGHRRSGLQASSGISAIGYRSSLCAAATGHLSCGCDTASYFGVRISTYPNGRHDLDLASNWGYLNQSPSPCVGCAAWRHGHVMAIIGGGPGGWRVRDFNSGRGVTHEYVAASFPGYRFAIPADLKLSEHRIARHHGKRIRYAWKRQ